MTEKTVTIHLETAMHLVAQTGSGHQLVMDDADGDGGARPTELLSPPGGCTAMDVMSMLRKKRQVVTDLDVQVRATQRSAYPRIFTDIDLVVEVEVRM